MTIIFTEIVKYKWYESTLILSNIIITFTVSWTSITTSQMAMISDFITFKIFFSKSKNIIISIILFIFLCHNDIFISIFEIESHFIF